MIEVSDLRTMLEGNGYKVSRNISDAIVGANAGSCWWDYMQELTGITWAEATTDNTTAAQQRALAALTYFALLKEDLFATASGAKVKNGDESQRAYVSDLYSTALASTVRALKGAVAVGHTIHDYTINDSLGLFFHIATN